ncbi:hypothetical protein ACEN88_35380, partial [Massilia sp. CT11-108]|uniref:hypothetical protein n=1 Tax=Massilia sp. CT11-108 TaxID=3393900 RepID=UPI0039A48739
CTAVRVSDEVEGVMILILFFLTLIVTVLAFLRGWGSSSVSAVVDEFVRFMALLGMGRAGILAGDRITRSSAVGSTSWFTE